MANAITREMRRTTMNSIDPNRVQHVRRTEGRLLLVAAPFLFVSTLSLAVLRSEMVGFTHFLAWVVCAATGHMLLNWRLPQRDPLLFPLAMFMSGWGLILIDRLTPQLADRQTIWLVIAVLIMLIAAWTSQLMRLLRNYRYTLLFGGLAVLAITIWLGVNPSDPGGRFGAPALWIAVGSFYIQPAEALKIVLVAFLASYLAEQYPALRAEGVESNRSRLALSPRILGPILLMWGLCVVVLVWQRDLGTAILFFLVFLMLLYVASGYTPLLFSGALMVIIAGLIAYRLFDVVKLRVDIWWNPWTEGEGRAYQIVQSLMAFAAGGVFGQGVGQGAPLSIPVVHSDFVLAAVAEEWGLLGAVSVIACQTLFAVRGLRVALAQQGKPFHTLLAVGLSSVIAVQSLLIMGGVLKLIPLTGVTLPFLSYGGSSLVVTFAITGLLLRLSNGDS